MTVVAETSEPKPRMWPPLHPDVWLYAFIAAYSLAAASLAHAMGRDQLFAPLVYYAKWGPKLLVVMALWAAWEAMRSLRATSPIAEFLRRVSGMRSGILMICAVIAFHGSFSTVKSLLPLLTPITHDPAIAGVDRFLHGGADAWRLLSWVPVAPLDFVYSQIWFLGVMLATVVALTRYEIRLQYMWTFLICWVVLGNVLAAVFMSGGPMYYDQLLGGDRFASLLASIDGSAADHISDSLWRKYVEQVIAPGSGISAFPSLHLSMATLLVLTFWRRSGPLVRLIAIAYWLTIMVGSVRLGWHYAIDGYFSTLVTVLVWKGVGAVQTRLGHTEGSLRPELRTQATTPIVS